MIKNILKLLLMGVVLNGCAVKIDRYEEINTKEDKKFYVISDLRFKTFVYNNDNDSVLIKTSFENGFIKMNIDTINRENIYKLKIGDYSFYRKIKKDTIMIKKGDKIEKYIMIQSEK